MTADHPHPPRLEDLLRSWLPEQRWYGGKGRVIATVDVEWVTPMGAPAGADPALSIHLVRVVDEDGVQERYQLLLGWLAEEVPQRLEHAVIGAVDGRIAYDAVHDTHATALLLRAIADNAGWQQVHCVSTQPLDTSGSSRVVGVEQSNTSIIYGDDYILKLFRRVQPGLSPDLDITRALTEARCPSVPATLGWVEGEVDGQRTTLAMLQAYIRSASDGWAMATASVRDLFAEGDLHAAEVGGDFAAEAERLGVTTAQVHILMAQTLESGTVGAAESQSTARQMGERLDRAAGAVAELGPYAASIRAVYDAVGRRTLPVRVQRVHGDYHLGQVMRTRDGWVMLDFEGEPARPLAERTELMSPLRDVAGMLRSLDYAARHLLAERGGEPQLTYRATEWATRNRDAFCDGYAKAAGVDPREESELLRAFELDKAVYEVLYEARNRPTWVSIPLSAISQLVSRDSPQP